MTYYKSFTEIAPLFGIVPLPSKTERARKCKFCGGNMTHIEGTNVYVCQNMITKTKKNKETNETYEVEEMCGNTIYSKAS